LSVEAKPPRVPVLTKRCPASRRPGRPEAGEAGEAAESGEGEGAYHEEAGSHEDVGGAGEHQEESILGINPDATWVVATVVIGWVVLATALLLFGSRVLILVALAAAAATVLDVMEVLRQLALANGAVAILATLMALSHAAIVVLAVVVLRWYGRSQRQGARVS
jgi:hypothetical protein